MSSVIQAGFPNSREPTAGLDPRPYPSWIRSFVEFTNGIPSPEIFRKWTAIAILSGAIERRAWIATATGQLYPSMYIVLVGRPGVGKSVSIGHCSKFWRNTKELKVAPAALTREKFIVDLAETCFRTKVLGTQGLVEYNSFLIASSEFGNLLPEDDTTFMNDLNELYDCTPLFQYHTKNSGQYDVKNCHVTLLAGTQPNFLAKILPDAAFGLGFASRLLLIYADEAVHLQNLFNRKENPTAEKDLQSRLNALLNVYGEFSWAPNADAAIHAFYNDRMPPIPSHSRLANYNTRRITHLMKLCMIASLDRGTDLYITLEDFEWAKHTLLEAEAVMPDAFKDMAASTDFGVMEELLNWMFQECAKQKRGLFEHEIHMWLARKVPAFRVQQIFRGALAANMLREHLPVSGKPTYLPVQAPLHRN